MVSNKKQIVILGAGYGGLRAALKLERLLKGEAEWQVLLIDQYAFHQLKTEIHEVAAGKISHAAVSVPIARLIKDKAIAFLHAEVTSIDFNERVVTTTRGKARFDKLIIALGSETEFFGIPGLGKESFTLSSIGDARRIKTHIRDVFAQARNEKDETKKRAMLTIIIGGGGFTGVELATELVESVSKMRREFEVSPDETQLIILEAADMILPGFDLELVNRVQQDMKHTGIRLMLSTPCVSVTDNTVILKTGENIKTYTFIWTGGVRACDLVAKAELGHGSRGRVIVNPYLESVDHPEVYVIGDNALVLDPVTNRPLAPTAQLAIQQADSAALNTYAEIKGGKRVRYVPKVAGQFISLGGRNAVGWVWRFKVTGSLAWFLKRMTVVRYLYSIGGLSLMVSKIHGLFFPSEADG